jgi:two-component system LytT family response regulator
MARPGTATIVEALMAVNPLPPLRVLVADDEPLARQHLRDLLREHSAVVVAECADGYEVAAAIVESAPDLVLLDVAMPGLDGFEVIETVSPERMPPVIFITAHDEHALRAFEVHALDYLLKPVSAARLRAALAVAVEQIRDRRIGELEAALRGVLESQRGPRYRRFCLVKRGERMVVVDLEQAEAIESAGNYVRLHLADGSPLFRCTLSGLVEELDPSRFVRVHRSHVVNLERVRFVDKGFGGDLTITLASGRRLPLQRRYLDQLKTLLGS